MGVGLSESSIGIKIADGTFYPVLEEGFQGRKKVVLTTVRDDQTAVQIDLYRGQGRTLEDAEYVGSLIIENITPSPRSEPEIEVVLGMDEQGNLEATASDRITGEQQTLSVSMESLGPDRTYDIPEFSFEKDEDLDTAPAGTGGPYGAGGFGFEEEAVGPEDGADRLPAGAEGPGGGQSGLEDEELIAGEAWPVGEQDRRHRHPGPRERHRRRPLLLALLIVLALLLIAGVAWLVYRGLEGQEVPALQTSAADGSSAADGGAEPPAAAPPARPPAAAEEPAPAVPVKAEASAADGSARRGAASRDAGVGSQGRSVVPDQMGRYALGPLGDLLPEPLAVPEDREGQPNQEPGSDFCGNETVHP